MKKFSTWAVLACMAMLLLTSACQKKGEQAANEAGQPAAAAGGEIAWMKFDEGMAKAKETGKPVMIDFYTDWCHWCKELDSTTYKDPGIVEILNRDFVCIKVNAEGTATVTEEGKQMSERDLAGAYQVTGFPTLWFFDTGCKKIGALPGFQTAADLKPVLTYITSGSCAKGEKYEDYLKSIK